MSKAPAFQFYPGDWMQDTRPLSLAAKGAWIDYLCAMWRAQNRGQLSLPWVGYSRLVGATVEQTKAVTIELVRMGICDAEINGSPATPEDLQRQSDGNLTLINRRMAREAYDRQLANKRQQKYDAKKRVEQPDAVSDGASDADLTPPSSSSSSSSSSSLRSEDSICPQLLLTAAPAGPPPSPVVMKIPLIPKDGEYPVTQAQVDEWSQAYPGVDVLQELRRAVTWCNANPTKRKTRRGCPAFLVKWLGRSQDRGPGLCAPSRGNPPSTAHKTALTSVFDVPLTPIGDENT